MSFFNSLHFGFSRFLSSFLCNFLAVFLIFTISTQAVFATQPQNTPEPNPHSVSIPDPNAAKVCDAKLSNSFANKMLSRTKDYLGKAKNFFGYATGITPMIKTWQIKEKRNFIFFEQPILGLISTPTASFFASVLAWSASHLSSNAIPFPTPFSSKFFWDSAQIYMAFNIGNFIRYSVAIDESLHKTTRYWLNVYYSWATYSIFTASDVFKNATTVDQKVYAYSLVTFAALWPFISQFLGNTFVVPYLYGKFPNDKERKTIYAVPRNAQLLIANAKSVVESKEKKLSEAQATMKKAELKKARQELTQARNTLYWTERLTDGVADHEPIPFSKRANFWFEKTRKNTYIAVAMVTLYFLLRWGTVGDRSGYQVGDWKPIPAAIKTILKDDTTSPEKKLGMIQSLTPENAALNLENNPLAMADMQNFTQCALNEDAQACGEADKVLKDFESFYKD